MLGRLKTRNLARSVDLGNHSTLQEILKKGTQGDSGDLFEPKAQTMSFEEKQLADRLLAEAKWLMNIEHHARKKHNEIQ